MGSVVAVVIAGGAASRFGADKLLIADAAGRTLLDATVSGAAAVADAVIVVGPRRPLRTPVTWIVEDPPGGGPCAALVAAMDAVPEDATHIALLAGDAPRGAEAVPALLAVIDDAAAATVVDADGREQPMTAVYAARPLREVLAAYGKATGMRVRQVLDDLRPCTVVSIIDRWDASDDVDYPEDARRMGYAGPGPSEGSD